MQILAILILLIYVIVIMGLLYFAMHSLVLMLLHYRSYERCLLSSRTRELLEPPVLSSAHLVAIHLPVYNEFNVIERLLDAVCKLNWPPAKLQIMILDDSSDQTSAKIKELIRTPQKAGFIIEHIQRSNRQDHKAGALREALQKTRADYIAVFDADFVPDPDFLMHCMPLFRNPEIGMIQTRWGHLNREQSILTQAQAIGMDAHFVIEQVARNANGLWMNFNGTGGIWRKQCLLEAGNWQGDTLTEDFDVSYRAELAGWQFQYLSDVVNPAEIPASLAAFKSQQFRWCKGSLQTACKLLPRIWRSATSLPVKLEASTHLLNYSVHPLMLLSILLLAPLLWTREYWPWNPELWSNDWVVVAFFSLMGFASSIPGLFCIYAQKRLYTDWWSRVIYLPFLVLLGVGLSLHNSIAYIQALIGHQSAFVRTPKQGYRPTIQYKAKLRGSYWLEILLGLYCVYWAHWCYLHYEYFIIPFMLMYSLGFLWLGLGSLWETLRYQKD